MLFPEAYVLWSVALLVVVVTREFHAILPLVVLFQTTVWLTSDANALTPDERDDFVVRRTAYLFLGAFAGLALAVAMRTRELIPAHTFHKNRFHLAVPLAMFTVGHGVYFIAVASGLTGGFFPTDTADIVFFWISFGLALFAVITFLVGLVLTWMGWSTPISFRYRDSGIAVPPHPVGRIIVEFLLAFTILCSTNLFWLFLSQPPVSWPQWAGGLISIALQIVGWICIYRVFGARYDMQNTYFAPSQSSITWMGFTLTLGGTLVASAMAYLIYAIFAATAFQTDLFLGILTTVVVFVSVGIWILLETPTHPPDYGIVDDTGGEGDVDTDADSMASINELRKRTAELGL